MPSVKRCEVCKREMLVKTLRQKYCKPCSEIKDLERKRLWARENKEKRKEPSNEERNIKRRKDKEVGLKENKKLARSIQWIHESNEEVEEVNTQLRIAVPFMYGISKNSTWSSTRKGHVYLREEHKQLRNMISLTVKRAMNGMTFYEDKVWLDIFVQKPNHKGDAINVIDAVCDAVKEVIGVDDRWYSIKRLDWQIVKENPRLYIGISQRSEGHKRICSYCGRVLTTDMFWKDKGDHLGIGRECKECKTQKARAKRRTGS